MHYPFWHVPGLTSPMLIAIIAVIHIFVAMYAVGGGIILAYETAWSYRNNHRDLLDYLKSHTWFFILLTVVFGAITGVGIWWIIGLASPLATEELIHIFVFGWAIEYVTFILEIVSAFIFFYYWGRLAPKTHSAIGWIYAGSAWLSLVIITGITAFQLNSGSYIEGGGFWRAFLNPQFIPQTFARTGGSLLLASLYMYLHSAFVLRDKLELRMRVGRHVARWSMAGAVLTIIGGGLWYLLLPASGKAALAGAAALNILMTLIFVITVVVIVMMYLGPMRNPAWMTPGFAILFFSFGLAAVATGEFIREAVRKPFVVYNIVLGNGIYTWEIPKLRENGYLESGTWTKAYTLAKFPGLKSEAGKIDYAKMLLLSRAEKQDIGRVLFQYHCGDCHAASGYSGMREITRGWPREMLELIVNHPEKVHFFMPPWCGNAEEAQMLVTWLESVREPHPPGMKFGDRMTAIREKIEKEVAYGPK